MTVTWAPVSMTADTCLPLTSRDTITDKSLKSSEQDDLTETSFREDVSGFGTLGLTWAYLMKVH